MRRTLAASCRRSARLAWEASGWGRWSLLLALAACAPRVAPAFAEAYTAGERAESAGRLDEALAAYDRAAHAATRAGDADEARWAAADVLERQGRTADAVARFDAMAEVQGSAMAAEAAYRAASLRLDHGEADRAWQDLEQIPRRYPTHGVAHAAVRRLVAHADDAGPDAAAKELASLERDLEKTELVELVAFLAAEHLEARGDVAGARDAFVRIADRWPYPYGAFFDDALWRASALEEKRSDPRAAANDLERMVAVRETTTLMGSYERRHFVPGMLRLAEIYAEQLHDHARARDTLHRLYADFAHSTMRDDALWLDAMLAKEDGDAAGACDRLAVLVRQFPESAYAPCAGQVCPGLAPPSDGGASSRCHDYILRRGWAVAER